MICPLDRTTMVNFTEEIGSEFESICQPLPSGGIATDEVYETWYVYECPKCNRRVKESYRCELLTNDKVI